MGNGIRPPLETQRGYNNSLQYLVGDFNPSEKKYEINWDDDIPN